MTDMTDTLKMAREALDEFLADYGSEDGMKSMKHYAKSFHAVIAAIDAQAPQAAPLDQKAWHSAAVEMLNGLSEAETSATASVAGLTAPQAAPVALTDAEIDAAVADIFIGDFEPGPYYDRAIARAVLAAAGAAAQGGDRG